MNRFNTIPVVFLLIMGSFVHWGFKGNPLKNELYFHKDTKTPYCNLDSIRQLTKKLMVLLHHPKSKKSLIYKRVEDSLEINRVFSFVGKPNIDSTCFEGGSYNTFGEIQLFNGTASKDAFAKIHFIKNGRCEGMYLETAISIERHFSTNEGKQFMEKLANEHRNWYSNTP